MQPHVIPHLQMPSCGGRQDDIDLLAVPFAVPDVVDFMPLNLLDLDQFIVRHRHTHSNRKGFKTFHHESLF
ncbi:MAG: hypothetical protein EU536_02950 [Promethearchaeota archaeon]|nr:MAG: hypothetical protein EU536_02950 [Candidatus Lokiarchaeota archaeon]